MSTLIIGDSHCHPETINKIIQDYKPDKIICMGDFFDNYGDTVEDNLKTAKFITNWLDSRSQDIILNSNHDLGYQFPNNEYLRCAGNTLEKSKAINSIMKPHHWNRFQLYHYEKDRNILFTHAGVNEKSFNGFFTLDKLDYLSKISLKQARENRNPMFLTNPFSIIWARHQNFLQVNQIFGHTPCQEPVISKKENIFNMDIDCLQTYFLEITENKEIYKINWRRGEKTLLFTTKDNKYYK